MGTLRDLEGISAKEIECEFIGKVSDIKKILDKGLAATTADNNGAINVWKDDEGFIRCDVQRFCSSLDTQKYQHIEDVNKWARKWLKKIK